MSSTLLTARGDRSQTGMEADVFQWKGVVLGVIAAVVAMAAVVFCYFRFGFAPVGAAAAPMPFEHYLARTALHAQTERAATVQAPVEPTEANLLAGARTYRDACAFCHGLATAEKTRVQRGMYPQPPLLLFGKGVTDDPVGETHWVVQKGIRMTGMPAFEDAYTDAELWNVSLLLAHAHELPPSVRRLLSSPADITVPANGTVGRAR